MHLNSFSSGNNNHCCLEFITRLVLIGVMGNNKYIFSYTILDLQKVWSDSQKMFVKVFLVKMYDIAIFFFLGVSQSYNKLKTGPSTLLCWTYTLISSSAEYSSSCFTLNIILVKCDLKMSSYYLCSIISSVCINPAGQTL